MPDILDDVLKKVCVLHTSNSRPTSSRCLTFSARNSSIPSPTTSTGADNELERAAELSPLPVTDSGVDDTTDAAFAPTPTIPALMDSDPELRSLQQTPEVAWLCWDILAHASLAVFADASSFRVTKVGALGLTDLTATEIPFFTGTCVRVEVESDDPRVGGTACGDFGGVPVAFAVC